MKELSIILIVSTSEAFLKDTLKFCETLWFSHTENQEIPRLITPDARKKLQIYLKGIKAYDEFLETRYVYSNTVDPDTRSLCEVLFEGQKEKEKINFQNLTKDYGVKVAYKAFFDIDLVESLDKDISNSHRRWEELIKLFNERHEIIHKAKETEFSEDELRRVLESIKYLKKYLTLELINRELGCGSGPFFYYIVR